MTAAPMDWDQRYATKQTPWDSGEASHELTRVLGEGRFAPCRALEIGCGTGTNAVFLAQRGFDVTAIDLSSRAIAQAQAKAAAAGVRAQFRQADVLHPSDLGAPFPFIFDRGVYHGMRGAEIPAFLATLARYSAPGGYYLTLAGNSNEPAPAEGGPPRVAAADICRDFDPLFQIVQLREFRFHGVVINGKPMTPLAWSVLMRRRG